MVKLLREWRQPGEPWCFYIVSPLVGIIVCAALIVSMPVHWMLKLLGFKDGLFS